MKTAILILAAGSSTRMGKAKQLLPFGKTTLLGLAIENALQSKVNKVYCVLGANAKAIQKSIGHYPIKIITNSEYHLGLSSSIKAGIEHLKLEAYDAILIMLADQPNVDVQYLNQFLIEINEQPTKIIASNYSGSFGVPAIFPKSFYPELQELSGDKGAKTFLNSLNEDVVKIDSLKLSDIDTPQDYLDFLESQ